jgi:hypothetical protein
MRNVILSQTERTEYRNTELVIYNCHMKTLGLTFCKTCATKEAGMRCMCLCVCICVYVCMYVYIQCDVKYSQKINRIFANHANLIRAEVNDLRAKSRLRIRKANPQSKKVTVLNPNSFHENTQSGLPVSSEI